MKAKIFLFISILMITLEFEVKAQATAYANIFATVVAPVGITKEMDFSAGEIINTNHLSSNQLSLQKSNLPENINLTQEGQVTVAAFQITGKNTVYAVSVQNQPVVLMNENANSVTINNFGSELAMTDNPTGGVQRISINATLNVAENQPKGYYDSTSPFNVTLNYN